MKQLCPNRPIVLVGCKKDLRKDKNVIQELERAAMHPVTKEEVCLSSLFNGHLFKTV